MLRVGFLGSPSEAVLTEEEGVGRCCEDKPISGQKGPDEETEKGPNTTVVSKTALIWFNETSILTYKKDTALKDVEPERLVDTLFILDGVMTNTVWFLIPLSKVLTGKKVNLFRLLLRKSLGRHAVRAGRVV